MSLAAFSISVLFAHVSCCFLYFVLFAILIECVSMSCLGFLPSEFIAFDHAPIIILVGLLKVMSLAC